MLVTLAPSLSAWAHGDEDHGGVAAPAPIVSAAPRIATATDQFELVGVLEGKVLKLYIDQFGTNEPVAKAQIEIESGAWKAEASEVSPAVYAIPAESLTQLGKHPLTITVQAGDTVELMNATLDVGPFVAADASSQHDKFWGKGAVWSVAVTLLLVVLGWLVIHRRQKSRTY